jgi:hypothetical protein
MMQNGIFEVICVEGMDEGRVWGLSPGEADGPLGCPAPTPLHLGMSLGSRHWLTVKRGVKRGPGSLPT